MVMIRRMWVLLLVLLLVGVPYSRAQIRRKRPRIEDDLRDVEDNEEDDEWRAWGESRKSPGEEEPMPAIELNNGPIDVSKLMKRQAAGPQLAFARLRPDPTGQRTQAKVDEIGELWTGLLRTGGMADQIYAVDEDTILINIADGKYMDEIKDFVLSRDEAYEFEWKNQKSRRPGDPPLELTTPPSPPAKEKKKASKKGKKGKKGNKKKTAPSDEL